jgi:hypothetical protein
MSAHLVLVSSSGFRGSTFAIWKKLAPEDDDGLVVALVLVARVGLDQADEDPWRRLAPKSVGVVDFRRGHRAHALHAAG